MALNLRKNSPSLFIICQDNLHSRSNSDLERLGHECTALKAKDKENQRELKRLMSENNLLQQRIKGLEKAITERELQKSSDDEIKSGVLRFSHKEITELRLREGQTFANLENLKLKLLESENQNQIYYNQIQHMKEENSRIQKKLEESAEKEKNLQKTMKDLIRKFDDSETMRQEEAILARIKNAENFQTIAELKHRIAEIDVQKAEMIAANYLYQAETENWMSQANAANLSEFSDGSTSLGDQLEGNSDEELDAEIKTCENFYLTLSDVITGDSQFTNTIANTEENTAHVTDGFLQKVNSEDALPSTAACHFEMGNSLSELVAAVSSKDCAHTNSIELNVTADSRDVAVNSISDDGATLSHLIASADVQHHNTESCMDVLKNAYEDQTKTNYSNTRKAKSKECSPSDLKPLIITRNLSTGVNIVLKKSAEVLDYIEIINKNPGYDPVIPVADFPDKDQHFHEIWELYDEVVEVDSKNWTRILKKNSNI